RDAYKKLNLAFSSNQFWTRQRLRAKSYDDTRLDSGRVKGIQSGVFGKVVAPVGEVIRLALLGRHDKVAKAYVRLLRASGIDGSFVEEVLSDVYKPLADRVERATESLSQELRSGDQTKSHYKNLLTRFKKDAALDLSVMIKVGDLPGYAEEHARDTAAAFLRELSIDAFNNADDHKTSQNALELANAIVDSQSDKERYKQDLSQIKHAIEFNPLFQKLRNNLNAENYTAALKVVTEIIEKGGDEDGDLDQLQRSLRTRLATSLHNQAVECANNGNPGRARRLLQDALRYEGDAEGREIIQNTIAAIGKRPGQIAQLGGAVVGGIVALVLRLFVAAVVLFIIGVILESCR
ncbi:MAG: hypothetical protein MK100_07890, partial [Phycisphaerales bacterium]|nr:hypothetical protein [Phycisphaerales bacterium]